MNSLFQIATASAVSTQALPSGRAVAIASWTVLFPPAIPDRMPLGVLKRTYTSKPLVTVDDRPMFGELAIVEWLAKDGWSALWVDAFHGQKFWRAMPHVSDPVTPPTHVEDLYRRIARRKGSPSGCFDVVAWNQERVIWLEYKGPRDRPNCNEPCWIEAAIGAGVRDVDLFFVGAKTRSTPERRIRAVDIPLRSNTRTNG